MIKIVEGLKDNDRDEPVAYIFQSGDFVVLCIRYDRADELQIPLSGKGQCEIARDGWNPDSGGVTRRFYRGDRITIEF